MEKEQTKEEKIAKEERNLLKLYKNIEKNKLKLLASLIQNAAFMKVTLEDLQSVINEAGTVDTYKNGAQQSGRKASAEVQSYNAMMKNYMNCIDRLEKLLPAEPAKVKSAFDCLRDE